MDGVGSFVMEGGSGKGCKKGDWTQPSAVNSAAALSTSFASRALRYLRTAFCICPPILRCPGDEPKPTGATRKGAGRLVRESGMLRGATAALHGPEPQGSSVSAQKTAPDLPLRLDTGGTVTDSGLLAHGRPPISSAQCLRPPRHRSL